MVWDAIALGVVVGAPLILVWRWGRRRPTDPPEAGLGARLKDRLANWVDRTSEPPRNPGGAGPEAPDYEENSHQAVDE